MRLWRKKCALPPKGGTPTPSRFFPHRLPPGGSPPPLIGHGLLWRWSDGGGGGGVCIRIICLAQLESTLTTSDRNRVRHSESPLFLLLFVHFTPFQRCISASRDLNIHSNKPPSNPHLNQLSHFDFVVRGDSGHALRLSSSLVYVVHKL